MTRKLIVPLIGFAALASAQTAQAQQQSCIAPTDLGDTVVYVMPIAYDAARTACANRFAKDGFVATKGDRFIASFRTRQNASWPGALRMLKVFMAQQDDGEAAGRSQFDINAMIAALPDANLRPFVDGMVGQMIAGEIKPDRCGTIERGMELLSPLPTENVAGLASFIADIADLKRPLICPTPSARARK